MASKWFEGLSAQAQGFLIATLLFRSKEREGLMNCLDVADASVLRERANSIMELERGQRVSLLVAELKRLLSLTAQPWLFAVDPSWIVELLKKEDPICQQAAFKVLPKSLAASVAHSLPTANAEKSELLLPPELSAAILLALEKQLTQMRPVSFDSTLHVSQLLLLLRSELELLIMEIGKRALAGAMSVLGVEKSAQMLESVDKSSQAQLIEILKSVKPIVWWNVDEAELYLENVFGGTGSINNYFENCGLWMLANLVSDEKYALQNEIAQRLEYTAGQKLLGFVKTLESKAPETKTVRLDLEFFSLIIELAKQRKIDERFAKCSLPE